MADDDPSPDPNGPRAATGASDADALLAVTGADDGNEGEPGADLGDPAPSGRGLALRTRIVGLLALALGVLGVLVSLATALLFIIGGFRASSAVDALLAPLVSAVERVETRIDQADDAIDRDGLAAERVPELRARAEGLADVAATADELLNGIRDHPIYRRLPADLEPLGEAVDRFVAGAERVDQVVARTGEGRPLNGGDASIVANELNDLQTGVGTIEQAIEDAAASLRRWIRVGAFVGMMVALWSAWAQFCLARRGLRGVRGHTV